MRLLWKLLRRHVSVLQLAGFFVTSLVGVSIVLAALQLRSDVMPVLSAPDSFLKGEYAVISPTATGSERAAFSASELDSLRAQPFVRSLGEFTAARYRVMGGLRMGSMGMQTYLFFESVPDAFLDVRDAAWDFRAGDREVPIILPRNYLNLYNFGFAATRGLPQITEEAVRSLPLDLTLGSEDLQLKGRVIGFSSRLNTILVPDAFMKWSNERLASTPPLWPSRVIVETTGDSKMYAYFKQHGYRTEGGEQSGQLSYALRLATLGVVAVGGLITLLAVIVLMLSIYLLLEKNTQRLQDLLLVGYSPAAVARPYQLLAVGLNLLVWLTAVGILVVARGYWLPQLALLADGYAAVPLWPVALYGVGLMGAVSLFASVAISLKIRGLQVQK